MIPNNELKITLVNDWKTRHLFRVISIALDTNLELVILGLGIAIGKGSWEA